MLIGNKWWDVEFAGCYGDENERICREENGN